MKKHKNSKLSMLIIICGVFYFLFFIFGYQQNLITYKNTKLKDIKLKIEEEKSISKKLLAEKSNINSDEYIEKTAREKLGMLKNDETIFVDTNKWTTTTIKE